RRIPHLRPRSYLRIPRPLRLPPFPCHPLLATHRALFLLLFPRPRCPQALRLPRLRANLSWLYSARKFPLVTSIRSRLAFASSPQHPSLIPPTDPRVTLP